MSKLKNLLSRKFLLTVLGYVGAIMVAYGCSDSTVKWVGILGALAINVIYILVEGKIDWTSVKTAAAKVSEVVSDLADNTPEKEDTTAATVESTEQTETTDANQATTSTPSAPTVDQALEVIKAALNAATTIQ